MLIPEEVAQDEEIFRPDGFIRFPRSDGDPTYQPPNTALPSASELEVNYYHVFGREEKRHDTWRGALGEQLAQYFKLEPLSRSKAKWKLYDFPEHYYFTEQRKGPRHDPRTDPYLFGSQGHRFRSTKEALDHLVWLLLDPEMNVANCRCKYCHKGPRASGGGDGASPKKVGQKRKPEMTASTAAAAKGRGRKSQADDTDVQSQTSITVRGVDMKRLVPGLTIASVPQRDQELMYELKRGEKERFRVGEVVWCQLDEPIVDPTDAGRVITSWPAVILDPSIDTLWMGPDNDDKEKTSLEAVSAPSQSEETLPMLGGPVHQSMSYQINFMGTSEKAKAPESSLIPYLTGLIPHELLDGDPGKPEEHAWLFQEDAYPDLNLARLPDLPAPNFTKALIAFCYAVEAVAVVRNFYNVTDAYSGSDTPEGQLRDLAASANGEVDGHMQGARYYQGIYLGLERLWVGDAVRLKMAPFHIKKLQQQLNENFVEEKAPGAPDPPAIVLDLDGSYVMQLAAIFENPADLKTIRVTGEIFQIISSSKYDKIKAEEEAKLKKIAGDETLEEAARAEEEAKALAARLPQPSVLKGRPGFPPMPPLPQGFVMISLSDRLQTRIPRETMLSIGHVAGRIYPSLGMHSDGPRVAEQIKAKPLDKKLAADEDTQIDLRARLSVAGLLSGCVKAMRCSVHAWTRTASFKGALAFARKQVRKAISDAPDSDDEADQSQEKTPAKKKAKKALSPLETPVQSGKMAGAVDTAAVQAAEVERLAQEAQKLETQPSQVVTAAEEGVGGGAGEEGPLPEGWETRQSRNLGSFYYVHTATKKTQWERPTAPL